MLSELMLLLVNHSFRKCRALWPHYSLSLQLCTIPSQDTEESPAYKVPGCPRLTNALLQWRRQHHYTEVVTTGFLNHPAWLSIT